MRRVSYFLIVIVFLISAVEAYSSEKMPYCWKIIAPVPQSINLNSVEIFYNRHSDMQIYAVGDSGSIVSYENSYRFGKFGYFWHTIESGTKEKLMDIAHVKYAEMVAVGAKGTVIRTESGTDWQKVDIDKSVDINAVNFYNDTLGYLAGEGGTIMKTIDGGKSWIDLTVSSIPNIWYTIEIVDENIVYIAGWGGIIIKSEDAGKSWKKLNKEGFSNIFDLSFVNKDLGYIVGLSGEIFRTQDAGETWEILDAPPYRLYSVHFQDENNGTVINYKGNIYQTQDGGDTWEFKDSTAEYMNKMRYLNNNQYAVAVGDGGNVFMTEDNWNTTERISTFIGRFSSYSTVNDVHIFPDKEIIMCGNNGRLYKSTDEGLSWSERYMVSPNLHKFFFLDDQIGYVLGNNGSLYKTSNRGDNLTSLNITATTNFTDIYFSDEMNGIIVSPRAIWKSTDGFATWEDVPRPFSTSAYCRISFVNANLGFMVASRSIYKTTDGGASWNSIFEHPNQLTDIALIDEYNGMAIGEKGTLLVTFNGGDTWQSKPSYTQNTLLNLYVLKTKSDVDFWILGTNNIIVRGRNYEVHDIDYQYESMPLIKSLAILDYEYNAYAVGERGLVLKIDYCGSTSVEDAFEVVNNDLVVYPNPANSSLYVSLNSSYYGDYQVSLTDLIGNRIDNIQYQTVDSEIFTINVDLKNVNISDGIYFINLTLNNITYQSKVIIISE